MLETDHLQIAATSKRPNAMYKTSSKTATSNSPRELDIDRRRSNDSRNDQDSTDPALERRLRLRIDIRLCTIAGLLCSLNLLDSGVISSAGVTSMLSDLDLTGNRFSVSIFIFTIASICFQLPSTIAVRFLGPRIWFTFITFCFGLITMCTAFVRSWKQMIALRVLLGISMSGIYPGLTYLISTYYKRREQQLRFAFMQTGEVIVLATGGIVNFGLNHLDGKGGLKGWQWMFLVQGLITILISAVTYWWMVDFPEEAWRSFKFLGHEESKFMAARIQRDRGDVIPEDFSWGKVLVHAKDPKVGPPSSLFNLFFPSDLAQETPPPPWRKTSIRPRVPIQY